MVGASKSRAMPPPGPLDFLSRIALRAARLASRPVPLIVHERGRTWGVRIRSRLAGLAIRVRLRETRTLADLRAAIQAGRGGIVLLDLTDQATSPLDLVARI